MNTKQRESKWWLAAILLPLVALGFGIVLALGARANENDWLGMRFIIPVFYGLLGGCVLSVVAAVISFCRNERHAFVAVLPAIPSLLFIFWYAAAFRETKEMEKRTAISNAAYNERQKKRFALIGQWRDRFKANPALITDDEFWRAQKDPERLAHWGMKWALQDKAFVVTPQIKAYIITNFPSEAGLVFGSGRSSHDELHSVVLDKDYPRPAREAALDFLLRDQSYDVQEDLKKLVNDEFTQKYGLLFGTKRFTKSELETLIQNPKTAEWVKREAGKYLQWGSYKKETKAE